MLGIIGLLIFWAFSLICAYMLGKENRKQSEFLDNNIDDIQLPCIDDSRWESQKYKVTQGHYFIYPDNELAIGSIVIKGSQDSGYRLSIAGQTHTSRKINQYCKSVVNKYKQRKALESITED